MKQSMEHEFLSDFDQITNGKCPLILMSIPDTLVSVEVISPYLKCVI